MTILPVLVLSLILISQENNNSYSREENVFEISIDPHLSAPNSLKPVWYRTWGGPERDDCILFKKDLLDNLYLVGQTESYEVGYIDICIVKYNNAGELQWNRTWGGVDFEKLNAVTLDSSNNIYITGITNSFDEEIFILKYNSAGELQWNHTWGGIGSDYCVGIVSDSSNNVYITGSTDSFGAGETDMLLMKYNSAGLLQWNYTWGGNQSEAGLSIASDASDNIYIVGGTESFGKGDRDICLIKYSSSGVLLWNRTWGGNESDSSYLMVLDSSNNIYITGFIDNLNGRVLVKFDSIGNQLWNHTLSIQEDRVEEVRDIVLDSLEDIYILGSMRGGVFPNHWSNIFLEKYSSSGTRLWNHTWDKTERDEAWEIGIDSLDNIYISGSIAINIIEEINYLRRDMILLKYDNSGALISEISWGGDEDDSAYWIALDSARNVYIAGSTSSYGAGENDMCIVKFVEIAETIIPGYKLEFLILIISGVSIITIISRFTRTLIRKK